ncbi:MAG: hypothetical protein L6Q57_05680 [Alphaproteobacteria bacterium]|nr:hypothetical protein [Alphaproteobacteria bacterium]
MIKILGMRRIIVLAVLLGLNALFASVHYLYVLPETQARTQQARQLSSKISTLQTDINRLQIEFAQISDQKEEFTALEAKGFFNKQDRSLASQLLEKVQKNSGVITAVASVKPGTLLENEEAKKAKHTILSSPMTVEITALDDRDVYKYIHLLRQYFPGHITIVATEIKSTATLTRDLLRSVSAGENPVLVQAKLELLWQTMIPESQAIQPGRKS